MGEDGGLGQYGYTQELRRTLGFKDLLVYGLIFMVPIAPFGIFGSVFAGSGGMIALAYAIGMLAMLFTANSYAQMAKAFPMAGSVYTYAGRGIASPVGFLSGWMILLDYVLVPSLLYLIAGIAMNSLLPAIPVWLWLVAFVLLNTAVNFLGIEMTAKVNRVMLVAQLLILAVFIVIGVVALTQGKGRGFSFAPLFDSATFSWTLVFGAVSIAVLSFLGFDGISTLAEENRDSARAIGRSMIAALLVTGVLFIVQTWVAALLVPDPAGLIANGDAAGTSFYDAARVAGGGWLAVLTAAATAVSWGFANSLVAQAATSRLLYAMARDRQLPKFLAKVHPTRKVPVNATLLVAGVSLALGLYMQTRDDGITLLSSLVNFGAMTAFLVLHVSVVVHYVIRSGSRDWWKHLIAPLIGFGILAYVVINAKVAAQALGFVWLGIGAVILVGLLATGRRPALAGIGGEDK
ncbi:APC family permease [Actinokineospora globicatena]|uniref:APC family permease n=1 Tax=Actinokineospora globicatena TaxID=103729 RepID=UPI0020A5CF4A|nr:APC family permease [Actinokineospora globicatena]MCP2305849.1 amino acid/polyamine/organocation transporter, APC superfamily (TC 2.A.3) [Actinokineospora globicatena]GLW80284.1 porin [Actinokineospora globicatena]GLW87113.1 porin [Actinokineospora globicatena]